MVHENYKEMLAAQALSALDKDDARSLDDHLRACDECRVELYEWEETAATLAFSALESRPLEPSLQLRDRILNAAHADSVKSARDSDATRVSNVVDLDQERLQRRGYLQTWGAIAAGLVFVALSVSLFVLWQQNRAAREELARLSEQVKYNQQILTQQQQAIEIIMAPGTRMAELAGTSVMPSAHAMLAFDKNGRAILMAKGLPPPPAGMGYQLWYIAGDRPMPGKVFTTDATGTGMLSDQVPAEALNAKVFAITLEPKEGVPAPTGEMYLKS